MYGITSFKKLISLFFGNAKSITTIALIIITFLTTLIENYIYSSAGAVWFLFSLYGIDWLTGVIKAVKLRQFNSKNFGRIAVSLVGAVLLLFMAFNAAKYSAIFFWLPSTIYAVLTGQQIISISENLMLIGAIKKNIFHFLSQKFSLENITKIFNSKKEG